MQTVTSKSSGELIGAVRLSSESRSRSYRRDRVCDEAGCSTVLSMYNGSVLCSVHEHRHLGNSSAPRVLEPGHPVNGTEEKL